eukprot:scaffold81387_cov19-Tisochrysis_lutea.AAC.2
MQAAAGTPGARHKTSLAASTPTGAAHQLTPNGRATPATSSKYAARTNVGALLCACSKSWTQWTGIACTMLSACSCLGCDTAHCVCVCVCVIEHAADGMWLHVDAT